MEVFRRWPSSSTAAGLYQAAGAAWPDYRQDVFARLAAMPPRDTVVFALAHLKDIPLAWNVAHNLGLDDDRTWSDLAKAYEKFDPLAVLPVHTELVEKELAETRRPALPKRRSTAQEDAQARSWVGSGY